MSNLPGDLRRIVRALDVVDDYARLYGLNGTLHRIAAEGYKQLGKQAQSQFALAEFYYANGQLTQAIQQLRFQLQNKLFHHLHDHIFGQWCKADHRIKPVAEFRCKGAFDGGCVFASPPVTAKADCRLGQFHRTGV